eukprot:3373929-Rhodomonas_salina.1
MVAKVDIYGSKVIMMLPEVTFTLPKVTSVHQDLTFAQLELTSVAPDGAAVPFMETMLPFMATMLPFMEAALTFSAADRRAMCIRRLWYSGSGTTILSAYARRTRCPVLTSHMVLRAWYETPSTDAAYGATITNGATIRCYTQVRDGSPSPRIFAV